MVTVSNPLTKPETELVLKPDARKHVGRIVCWLICWPWDFVWMLLAHNPMHHLIVFMAREIRAAFDEISRGELQQIEQDLSVDCAPPVGLPASATLLSQPTVAHAVAAPRAAVVTQPPAEMPTMPPTVSRGDAWYLSPRPRTDSVGVWKHLPNWQHGDHTAN